MFRTQHRVFRTLIAGVFTMLAAVPVWGQSADPGSSAAFRKGPLAFTPSLTVPALGFESNVFYATEDPKEDYSINLQPQIAAWLRAGRFRLEAREQVNLIYYRTYTSESALNINTNVRVSAVMNRVSPYAAVAHLKTTERPSPEVNTRVEFSSTPLTGGATIRVGAKTSMDVGIDYLAVLFDDAATFQDIPLKGRLDRSTTGYRGTLSYAVTAPTAVTVSVAKETSRFGLLPNRNTSTVRFLPGISFSPFALVTGRAELGMLWLAPDDPGVRPFTGLAARVDLGYVLLGNTRFGLQVSREVTPSIDAVETYFVQTGITTTITHRFTERWDVTVAGTNQDLAYGGSETPAVGPVSGRDTVATYNASIGFSFNRGLRLGVKVESSRRVSRLPNASYDNLRLMSSFAYGFQ